MARYLLDAWDEYGNRVQLPVEWCSRCGAPVYLTILSMLDHLDAVHPVEMTGSTAPPARHALREDID